MNLTLIHKKQNQLHLIFQISIIKTNIFLISMQKGKKSDALVPKNHIVAYEQFFIGGNRNLENKISQGSNIKISQNKHKLNLEGQNFNITFNKKNGALIEIDYGNGNIIERGIKANFLAFSYR